jgi:PAS domain S-box-containing protein
MRRPAPWIVFLALGGVLTAAYLWVPGLKGLAPLFNLLGLSPVIAILVGLRLHKPAAKGPWLAFAAGMALFWLGDLYTYSYPKLLHREVPFPSLGDAFYVLVYPLLMTGLLLLVRRRNPETDRAGAIDSVIMTLGLSLLSWVALIAPYLHDGSLGLAGKLTSVAYPLGDILLLAAAIRLSVDAGRRQASFYLVAASIVALLFTDFFYGLATLHGTFHHQLVYDLGWIAFYLLFGASALHPSMRGLQEPVAGHESRLTMVRLALLTAASLVAPAIEFVASLGHADGDLLVVIGASAILFGFVVARMTGLVFQQQRSAERERTLGGVGSLLMSATTRVEIGMRGEAAAQSLAGEHASVRIVRGKTDGMAFRRGERWPLAPYALDGLREASEQQVTTLDEATCLALRLPLGRRRGVVFALGEREGLEGFIVVAGTVVDQRPVREALHGLGAQVKLAMESAALTEEIHRRAGESRLSALVQHSSDLIAVLDAAGLIAYISPSIERVLGYRPEDATASLLLGVDDRLVLGSRPGETAVVETVLHHRDGTPRDFEIQLTNLLDDERVRGIASSSTRPSTTTSPGSPTARCSASACATPSPARGASGTASRSCSSTSTTSRRSTTRSATRPATRS